MRRRLTALLPRFALLASLPRFALLASLSCLLLPPAGGCALYHAYAQRQAIQQARFHLKSISVGGLDLSGANLLLTLELENPTTTAIVLDRLDYTLFVNDRRIVAGFTDRRATVPPGEVRPVTFDTYVRYADLGEQARTVLRQGLSSWRLEGVGHFDTPVGTVDYPVRLLGR